MRAICEIIETSGDQVRTKRAMDRIRFEKTVTELSFLNPLKDFAEDLHTIEVRRDPLLGDVSVYNPYLKDKAKAFFGENDPDLVARLIQESSKTCFFCGERVEQGTPRYAAKLLPEGRLRVGEALLFANLFPVGAYHPVVSLCKAHFLRLSEFRPALLADGFRVCRKFLNLICGKDPSAVFTTVNSNYLFPAGASLVHPHLQMLITPLAYSFQARLLEACTGYFHESGSSYFTDLISAEKKNGRRYIAQTGEWHWLASFSPMGSNEIIAVHSEERDFGLLNEKALEDLAEGLSKVLAFYETLGHLSFNYTIYSVKRPRGEGFRCLMKVITRQNLYPDYRNDDYFLQKLLQSELIINPPEELAERLKAHFLKALPEA